MEGGVKILPPRSLFQFEILSISAFYVMYGDVLAVPGSIGFLMFVAWALILLAPLFWPHWLTVPLPLCWTVYMSLAVFSIMGMAIIWPTPYGIAHAFLCMVLQWGSAFYLFKFSSMEWLILDGYAPRPDMEEDEDTDEEQDSCKD